MNLAIAIFCSLVGALLVGAIIFMLARRQSQQADRHGTAHHLQAPDLRESEVGGVWVGGDPKETPGPR